jgi:transposase InsO family protein
MQVFGLPGHVIRNGRVASRLIDAKTPHIEAAIRRDAVWRWRAAMAKGLAAEDAAKAVGHPRATLYRWEKHPVPGSRRPHRLRRRSWSCDLVRAVERLRLDFPMWGKATLGPILRREGFSVSDSTVGRILAHLVARGVVEPVPTLRHRLRTRRAKPKRPHAIRLPRDLETAHPGDLVQLDTLSVGIAPERTIKHFTAYDPKAKWTVAQPFNRATAKAASLFLDKLIADMPFKVKAIQVDGGSEFMGEFEEGCARRGIALFVLPPRTPELNGAVERCNGSWRYEFYACRDLPLTIPEIASHVDAFQHLYNTYRPHRALAGLTPKQYLDKRRAEDTLPSHMS